MKTISIQEIKESLAGEDAENIYEYRDKVDIFLNGWHGYNNHHAEDCIDWYVTRHYPSMFTDDSVPVIVLQVVDDRGVLICNIVQHQHDVTIEWA